MSRDTPSFESGPLPAAHHQRARVGLRGTQVNAYSDPRDWTPEQRHDHLVALGLTPLLGRSSHQGEFSEYKGVTISWTSTLDIRITTLIDIIGRTYNHLWAAQAHKGSCSLWWDGSVPSEYAEGQCLPPELYDELGDSWWISSSTGTDELHPETLRNLPYREYLETEHWQRKRREALRHYGHDCVLCGSEHRVHVHHRRYDNLGEEPLSDLIVLCHKCHGDYHKSVRR